MARIEAVLFDAYGTLFDVHSAATRHKDRLGETAARVSALWRQKQLEYTWTLSLRQDYRDFAALTREALVFALAVEGFADDGLAEAMFQDYLALDPYADAATTIEALSARGLRLGILSNGTPAMLRALVDRVPFGRALSTLLSVDALRVYKPDARVYQLGADALKLPPERIGFVSSNAWDAGGGAGFGFRVFWINRARQPAEYDLAQRATVITSLDAIVAALD